jgi:predicted small lipoprotein YifL
MTGPRGAQSALRAGGVILVALVLALELAGCGKKGAPNPPPGVPNTYPRSYPRE